ncbi:MAG: PVC-type heme-binding CxxCH protein, partial [Verrucomicrobiota bacterium]
MRLVECKITRLITITAAAWILMQLPQAIGQTEPVRSPLSPKAALQSFQLESGLAIELVAAEPAVVSPVALAFDERGRLFVAENRGYPTGPEQGTIAMLEDKNADGQFETRTTFADGLHFPNGVLPWNRGLIVTCAPDVLHLIDTDGDGRADVRRVLFTGFATNGSTQLRVSHPTFAPDNWIYLSSGLKGGKVFAPDFPEAAPIELRSDFRFRLATAPLRFEAADGMAQFGLTFNDRGHRFICMNRVQVQHVVLPSRYLKRNPNLAFSGAVQNCPEEMLPEPLKGHGASARIFPISENITTADSHAGTFTAACGILIYRGTALPEEFYGNALSCDPTGNLVHRDRLVPSGPTFSARAAIEGKEMLASKDNWFRPVFLALGPDGAVYVCDMYRKTIEHPEYLPEEIRKRTDFQSGKDRGRIWRIRGVKEKGARQRAVDLSNADVPVLCETLANPNAWSRETAQRLLLERKLTNAAPRLELLLRNTSDTNKHGRFHALWMLAGLGALREEWLASALRDADPAVQESALLLAEDRLPKSETLAAAALALADSHDARVRFQAALSLGQIREERIVPALVRIGLAYSGHRWTRAAVLSSVTGFEPIFFEALMRGAASTQGNSSLAERRGAWELMQESARLLAVSGKSSEWPSVLAELLRRTAELEPTAQFAVLAGLASGIES